MTANEFIRDDEKLLYESAIINNQETETCMEITWHE